MNKAIVNKILITLGFLFAYRVLAYIPVPGVDATVIKDFLDQQGNNALGYFNMFSGNALERVSIISLGIMPYITSSIIMELLSATFPSLAKMKKERDSMQKYMQIVRYMTVVMTLIQAITVSFGLQSGTELSGAILFGEDQIYLFVAIAAISMLAGTMMLMWIGEQITQRGIGNGISLIIFAGIVSSIPSAIGGTFKLVNTNELSYIKLIGIVAVIIVTILAIIYVELGERRIAISYARKVLIQNQHKRIMNYIPIKMNLSGVIPPIFASAILMFPATLLQATSTPWLLSVRDWLSPDSVFHHFLMFIFVIFFAYFYASIVFNAKDISDNLKRQGGFIPGIRPGEMTAETLNNIASRLTLFGSLYLAVISTLPWLLVKGMGVPFYFGGTAVLIVVQVALDTMRKIQSQIIMNRYQTLSAVGL
ncbi:preprotein translocase subunit SecY [Helicobacter monodelphidis]|uniref:preprotein translocase subunit SecY n=1 Tax=Helicobacter sp. 15-1451 TaxID=2004995 RepID=UPI000DCD0AB0|nr:preprotein translocase subunit SecY [Helicobacter sp. 15-1451]RAX57121.1 preprotein translocase subunit SecY [Helicobacter sp. 15-1451]